MLTTCINLVATLRDILEENHVNQSKNFIYNLGTIVLYQIRGLLSQILRFSWEFPHTIICKKQKDGKSGTPPPFPPKEVGMHLYVLTEVYIFFFFVGILQKISDLLLRPWQMGHCLTSKQQHLAETIAMLALKLLKVILNELFSTGTVQVRTE